jgi:diaminohydroxyphosphoribosylaminopyrimidine deaminase/5-amino-6-(5-phosphoribosylamino)uracil reductase
MADFTFQDCAYMADAIRLGWRGRYGAHPNPRVGCLIVRDGEVVGRGWHERAGEAHAEVNALAEAGSAAAGATVYVTLEPCSHEGKTPPCARALIDAGVGRVVAAMADPFPAVAGQGLASLAAAGIAVSTGLLEAEARKLNEGYLSRIERGRPFVRLKIAASLDGATAMQSGESQWITGTEARRDVQRLRAASGAVMTGSGTVLTDDPSLTVRDFAVPAQPLRVVLDSTLRTAPSARLLSLPGETEIFCVDDGRAAGLRAAGASVRAVAARNGRVDVDAVLASLAGRDINDVLVEAGPTLAGSLLECGAVDELVIYQSPHIMGSHTRRMFATPERQTLDARYGLVVTDTRRIGADTRIIARPR